MLSCIWLMCTPIILCMWTWCNDFLGEYMDRVKYVQHTLSMSMKWYRLWWVWPSRYDCSWIPFDFFKNQWIRKFNTYMLYHYWEQTDNPIIGDIVAMDNIWTWQSHTAIFIKKTDDGLLILDGYPSYRTTSIRLHTWSREKYKIRYIKNPYFWWHEKLLKKYYWNL